MKSSDGQELIRRSRALVCLSASLILLATPSLTDSKKYTFGPAAFAPSEFQVLDKLKSDQLPLALEANHGQVDPEVKFFARGRVFNLQLGSSGALLTFSTDKNRDHTLNSRTLNHFLRLELMGANAAPEITGEERLQSLTNYFVGSDPQHWQPAVDNYGKVRYKNAYPGIDVVYYGNQLALEYDFVVSPGAEYRTIVMSFDGAESIAIDPSGDLVLHTPMGVIRQHKPVAYQELDGFRTDVASRYVLLDETVSNDGEKSDQTEPNRHGRLVKFDVEQYDPGLPLVIDPVLSYSSYLGGITRDEASAVAVDSSGNVYIAGYTNSTNFPLVTTSQVSSGDCPPCGNVFVTKINSSGTAVVYTTIVGGSLSEGAKGISVDSLGNAYITGYTFSQDFPVTDGAFQTHKRSAQGVDIFVTKLNPSGSNLVYSTYLGGSRNNQATAITVTPAGDSYITGYTYSDDFPTTPNAFQASRGDNNPFYSDAFVTKMNPHGSGLSYSTYLGGSGIDRGNSLAVDSSGNAYVTGKAGAGYPTTVGAFQPEMRGGNDAFVTKLRSEDGAMVYSTYLGGTSGLPDGVVCPADDNCLFGDEGLGIALDSLGNAYVTGATSSDDFPSTPGSFNAELKSSSTLFTAKLNVEGKALVYSAIGIGGVGVAVDQTGSAYVTGTTLLDTIPILNAFQSKRKGGVDAYIAKLEPSGSVLNYCSYLGGEGNDFARAIAVDAYGDAYIVGYTASENFKLRNAFQSTFGGQSGGTGSVIGDAFVAKISLPRIINVAVSGRKLFVTGENFDDGAVILLNGQKQKTANDEQRPDSLLIGKKAARQILPGQSVDLQVRNSDGTLSAEFVFKRPIE
jgi:hypothetical protein